MAFDNSPSFCCQGIPLPGLRLPANVKKPCSLEVGEQSARPCRREGDGRLTRVEPCEPASLLSPGSPTVLAKPLMVSLSRNIKVRWIDDHKGRGARPSAPTIGALPRKPLPAGLFRKSKDPGFSLRVFRFSGQRPRWASRQAPPPSFPRRRESRGALSGDIRPFAPLIATIERPWDSLYGWLTQAGDANYDAG